MVLLGAGGASRAIALQALSERVNKVFVANRSVDRGAEFVRELGEGAEFVQLNDRVVLARALAQSKLVVNATSAGLDDQAPPVLTAQEMHNELLVFDTVYGQGANKLMREAQKAGVKWCDGLQMLLYQGIGAFQLWTNEQAPKEVMSQTLQL
jgi:shikimate dehydrogenase